MKMTRMMNNGRFLPVWERRPFLWLLDHMETKGDSPRPINDRWYKQINERKIGMLPEHVARAVSPVGHGV
jgi:hypothetical protein